DGGVNPDQTPEIFESIIKNAVELAGDLGNGHPNIAMLSLIEKINEKVPETVIARELVRRFEHRKDLTIEGPIALDVCSSEEAAAAKGIISRIAGKTDIFVGPRITTINFMVKALINLGGAQGGGIIMGAQTPVVLLSRSDTLQSKLNSIALGIIALKG
ncbi:MAG: phosphate butyryltransferase, partial [FCB group bacterium]|nr:phosphate butyryltransferase [FCB group bacterium]